LLLSFGIDPLDSSTLTRKEHKKIKKIKYSKKERKQNFQVAKGFKLLNSISLLYFLCQVVLPVFSVVLIREGYQGVEYPQLVGTVVETGYYGAVPLTTAGQSRSWKEKETLSLLSSRSLE
jgi:hypothetical protein